MMPLFLRPLLDAGGEVYEVGGQVRDRLLGRPLGDGDYLVRHLKAEQIIALLKPLGKVITVGQSFGVIKFSPHRKPETIIDIALPRKEYSTGLGHRDFEVSFDPELPVDIDLGRRDFTINAMARNISTNAMIDPFGGKHDLEKKIIRMVFPAAFEEDPLRMLRAIQFATRFDFHLEPATEQSLIASAHLMATVAPERIIAEIKKIMEAPKPSVGFRLMAKTGLLPLILPELQALIGMNQDKQPGDDVFDHTMRVLDAARSDDVLLEPGEMNLMFAALLHDIGKSTTARYHAPSKRVVFFGHQLVSARMAKKWFARMRVETIGVNPKIVLPLVEHHMFETKASFSEKAIRRFIAKIGKDLILKLMDLRIADNRGGKHPAGIKGVMRLRQCIRQEIDRKAPFGPKDLAVNGHDLMSMGILAGPNMGHVIHELVQVVLDHPEFNTREYLTAFVSKWREHEKEKKENQTIHKG